MYVEKEPGQYTLTQNEVGGRFALVAFRTGVIIQDSADVAQAQAQAQAQALQAKLSVQQAKTGEFFNPINGILSRRWPSVLLTTRSAMKKV